MAPPRWEHVGSLVRVLSRRPPLPLGPGCALPAAGLLKGLFIPVWTAALAASKAVCGKSYFPPNQKSSGSEHKHSAHYLEITSPLGPGIRSKLRN